MSKTERQALKAIAHTVLTISVALKAVAAQLYSLAE